MVISGEDKLTLRGFAERPPGGREEAVPQHVHARRGTPIGGRVAASDIASRRAVRWGQDRPSPIIPRLGEPYSDR
jgi:hypothetical protein